MPASVSTEAPPRDPLKLEGELTIYRAAELKALLLARIADPDPLEIDLAGVTEVDTAGLQLLVLAKRESRALGREAACVRHSPPVLEAMRLTGLARWFGDALVEGPASGEDAA